MNKFSELTRKQKVALQRGLNRNEPVLGSRQTRVTWDDYETIDPNDYFEDAQRIWDNHTVKGYVDEDRDIDWYRIRWRENGQANFFLEPQDSGLDVDLRIYDDRENVVGSSSNGIGVHELVTIPVQADRYYYIRVRHYVSNDGSSDVYLLRCKNYPDGTGGGDGDDNFATATTIQLGDEISGTIDKDNDQDYFFLETPRDGYEGVRVALNLHGADYHCDITIYDQYETRVGTIFGRDGQSLFLKFPRYDRGYYIRLDFDGTYNSSENQGYTLTTTPIFCEDILRAEINGLESAYPIEVNSTIKATLEKYDENCFITAVDEDMDVTFIVQPQDDMQEFRLELLDENGLVLDYHIGGCPLEVSALLTKGKPYFIRVEPERNSAFYYAYDYLLYSFQSDIGGWFDDMSGNCKILSAVPKVREPYTRDQLVTFDVQVQNLKSRTKTYEIRAILRDENSEFGPGPSRFDVTHSSLPVTLSRSQIKTVPVVVRMAQTGHKDLVFETTPGAKQTLKRNYEVRGYSIENAIADLKLIEDFIYGEMGSTSSQQDKFNQTLKVIRSFIYNKRHFNEYLGIPNQSVANKVEQKFKATSQKNLINGTILKDKLGRAVDFVHMLCVFEGCIYPNQINETEIRSFFSGWFGDVASDAEAIKKRRVSLGLSDTASNTLKAVLFEDCAQINEISCKCSIKDIEADVDAVALAVLYHKNPNLKLSDLLKRYYITQESINDRYTIFKEETIRIAGGTIEKIAYDLAVGAYDLDVPGAAWILSGLGKFSKRERIECARVFTEYINSEGRITSGNRLQWNNTWYK